MPAIIRTDWSGTSGGPGLTQMCLDTMENWPVPIESAGQDAVDAVRAFWLALQTVLPNELTLQVQPQIDNYNTLSGDLDFSITVPTTPAAVLGNSSATYAGGSGIKVVWETNQIKRGRRVRGSTFIVPAAGTAFSNTGVVTSAAQTTINNAAATLLTTLETNLTRLLVWSRPVTLPTPRVGDTTPVEIGVCSQKSAILRSRRD